jgi:hypothetical protein
MHQESRDGRKSECNDIDYNTDNEYECGGAISQALEWVNKQKLTQVIKDANYRFVHKYELDYQLENK